MARSLAVAKAIRYEWLKTLIFLLITNQTIAPIVEMNYAVTQHNWHKAVKLY